MTFLMFLDGFFLINLRKVHLISIILFSKIVIYIPSTSIRSKYGIYRYLYIVYLRSVLFVTTNYRLTFVICLEASRRGARRA